MNDRAEFVLDARATLGEGPVWDSASRCLYWVDILGQRAHVFDTVSGQDRAIPVPQTIGCLVLRNSGQALAALDDGIYALDLNTGVVTPFALAGVNPPGLRFNDGKCDKVGRLWVGTMISAPSVTASATLYRVDPDGRATPQLDGVRISNGIAWSPDHTTMYYVDTSTRRVDAFDFDAQIGSIANRRTVVRFPEHGGLPDGMASDCEGRLWIAFWDGWRVGCYDPTDGRHVRDLRLPVARVTSCAFGGPHLDQLYITTARPDDDDEKRAQPQAGGLFCAALDTQGLPVEKFGG